MKENTPKRVFFVFFLLFFFYQDVDKKKVESVCVSYHKTDFTLAHTHCLSLSLTLCMGAAIIESDSGNLVQFVVNPALMTPSAG